MAKIVTYDHADSGVAYDMSHGDDDVKDGTVIVIPDEGLVVIMYRAWPVLIPEAEKYTKKEVFHTLAEGSSFETMDGGVYAESYKLAKAELAKLRPEA